MATPTAAALRAGGVVHAVTGDGGGVRIVLEDLDDAQLVLGLIRAAMEVSLSRLRSSGSSIRAISAPASGPSPLIGPNRRPIASVVPGRSPVTIMTRMPALWQSAITRFAPFRGGFIIPWSPVKISSRGSSSASPGSDTGSCAEAVAMTLNPRPSSSSLACWIIPSASGVRDRPGYPSPSRSRGGLWGSLHVQNMAVALAEHRVGVLLLGFTRGGCHRPGFAFLGRDCVGAQTGGSHGDVDGVADQAELRVGAHAVFGFIAERTGVQRSALGDAESAAVLGAPVRSSS